MRSRWRTATDERCTDPIAAPTAAAVASTPHAPRKAASRTTGWRSGRLLRMSLLTGQPLQSATALRVQLSDLTGEVRERELAELVDDRIDLGPSAQIHILLARVHGP